MKVKMIREEGQPIREVDDCWGERLIEQGEAIIIAPSPEAKGRARKGADA